MHAYAWYVWRKEPRSGPSLKVRVGRRETIAALSHEHADPTPSVRERSRFSVTPSVGPRPTGRLSIPIKPTLTIEVKAPA